MVKGSNRKMFRKPGMARRAIGILASSPELMQAAKVDTAITNIARFSKQLGVNYKTMKIYNPWLLQNHLNNKSRKLYHIALPEAVGP